jgi:hypothetical protein
MWKPVMSALKKEGTDATLLCEIKRYVSYSSASYGDFGSSFLARRIPHLSTDSWFAPRNHHSFATATKNHVSAIYHSSDSSYKDAGVYSPKFFLVANAEAKSIILTLRGTLSFHDLLVGMPLLVNILRFDL